MLSDDLDKLLKKAIEAEPVPDFDRTWQGAKSRVGATDRVRIPLRIIWIPVAAVGAAAVLAVVLNLPGGGFEEEAKPVVAKKQGDDVHGLLAGLENPEIKIITLDEFEIGWSPQDSKVDDEGETDGQGEVEITRNTLGEGMFESPTDFLLDLEVPKWNGGFEKGVSDEDS